MPKVVAGYKAQARARIVDAARSVFEKIGFARATMEDIAREVGVSKGALYIYFRTKRDLLNAVQSQFRQEVFGKWEQLLDEGDVAEEIAHTLDTIFSGKADPAIWHELLKESEEDPKLRAALERDQQEDTRKLRQFLRRLEARRRIRPMGDSEVVTDLVLALLQSTSYQIQIKKGPTRDLHRKLVRSLRYVLGPAKDRRAAGNRARPR
jgi:AcrR family transcriptional regulator